MNYRRLVMGLVLAAAAPAWAGTPCEEVKAQIDAKIKAKGVPVYTLDVQANGGGLDGSGKVVGHCEGGSKQIVYTRGAVAAKPAAAPAEPALSPKK